MEKRKVSRFEYAIAELADDAENIEPYTEAEELEIREAKLRSQFSRLKIINQQTDEQ